jgi:glucan biosynthesis protein C
LHLAVAVLATIGCLLQVGLAPKLVPATREIADIAYAIAYAVAAWSWTFAIVGLGLRFLSGHSPLRRYLADASYWIYIAHLPLVMALQVVMSRVAWPWAAELALVLVATLAILLPSYDLLVRNTFVGSWLNGRRKPRGLERIASR